MLGILVKVEDGNEISSSDSDSDISLMFKCTASPEELEIDFFGHYQVEKAVWYKLFVNLVNS